MNKFFKYIALILVLAVGGFAYYMTQNGLDPFNIDDIKIAAGSTKSKMDRISEVVTEKGTPAKESKVYKRKDAEGNWYYSNEPPKEGEEAELQVFRSDTNVLPPLPEDKKK